MIKQCCMCRKVFKEQVWIDPSPSELDGQTVSHGFCERCYEEYMDTIRKSHATPAPEDSLHPEV